VDLLGVTYSASTLATGYGAYIAQPLLRKAVEGREDTLSEQEARTILGDALRVLFYRDARSINQVKRAFLFLLSYGHSDRAEARRCIIVSISDDNCERRGPFRCNKARDRLGLCGGHKRLWSSDAVDEAYPLQTTEAFHPCSCVPQEYMALGPTADKLKRAVAWGSQQIWLI